MSHRIFSRIVRRTCKIASAATLVSMMTAQGQAQDASSGLYKDASSGFVYRKVCRTVERPVVETRMQQRSETVYRPQTVTETKPESRTVYTPIVEYAWEPRLHGRWNPFRPPTVAYHSIPRARWEARRELVQRTNTRTEWVAEQRTVEVPHRTVRMEKHQVVDLEPVGSLAGPPVYANAETQQLASRLRPLAPQDQYQPLNSASQIASNYSPQVLPSSSVGRLASDGPGRSSSQSGMRPTTLAPGGTPGVHGQPLPPASSAIGIAGAPRLPLFR